MAARAKSDTQTSMDINNQAMDAFLETAKQAAPMVQRFASHRDRFDLAIKELENERFEIVSRRDHLRRQIEAVESGFAVHLEDIESTLRMYENGINALGLPQN